jgi:methylmalonyl-CoA mutase N-terminal domain/subunit
LLKELEMTNRKNFEDAKQAWKQEYANQVDPEDRRVNRSGIEVDPLYLPNGELSESYMAKEGFPGQEPRTRGIYASMHRGRVWSQRQLIGLATPREYNQRMREIVAAGASALSMIPCNSVYRGYDIDEVDPVLLGTCGTTINSVDDMATCLEGISQADMSISLNDPLPFTLLALALASAKRNDVPISAVSGTSNQSDYISHYVANHMFLRLSLDGSRRVLMDHILFANTHLPKWNPVSIVGQHMQQAGATPAQAMGFALSTAIQYADDCRSRGMDPDEYLPKFTFFFDISISFFEEIAKFRAGRRIWSRISKEQLGATDPRSQRFKFHAQTSGVDLTRQQPLNNIARVATQAIAGIFGGLQSMHSDAYDEVLSTPTKEAAKIAVATQNILREEAHLCDVIDPLGGSYYVETLTDEMEHKILETMDAIAAAGGMFAAVRDGLVQRMIGESATQFQKEVDAGNHKIVGVNAFVDDDPSETISSLERPNPDLIESQLQRLKAYKKDRSQTELNKALDAITQASNEPEINIFEKIVAATEAGATHGEICARVRRDLGFGQPLVAA